MHGPRQSGNKVERRGEKKSQSSLSPDIIRHADNASMWNTHRPLYPSSSPSPFSPAILDLRSRSREFLETVKDGKEGGKGEKSAWNDYCHGASICRNIHFLGVQFTLSDVFPFIWQLRSRSYLIGPARCVYLFFDV